MIPAYNEGEVIERCLKALLADAREGEFEIVVVCNGCKDDTAARAQIDIGSNAHDQGSTQRPTICSRFWNRPSAMLTTLLAAR